MIATAIATLALATGYGSGDRLAFQSQAPCGRVCRRHKRWRRVIRPYRGWLLRLERCESGGNPRAIDPSGTYTGLFQFDDRTWRSVGGRGRAMHAGPLEQRFRAVKLRKRRGTAPWPACGR